MNELKEEIKKNVIAAQETTNKFAGDPLWESQAWFLRTRLKFGNDYQQFWDHTQGQINDYVTNLNSEDQVQARAEVAESFTIALKSGFDDCNKQVDSLLQQVFQVKQLENNEDDDSSSNVEKKEPEIIDLLDVEDESVNSRKRADPPSKDDVEKVDPEPSHENTTVTSSIVAVLEESGTEEEEDDVRVDVVSETIEALEKKDDDAPRNDRLQVALPHRSLEPEITRLVLEEEEPLDVAEEAMDVQPEITSLIEEEEPVEIFEETIEESSPEVIDLTNEEQEQQLEEVIEVVDEQVEEVGESLMGQDNRDDDEPTPSPSHSRGLSLTQILLDTYCEETQDAPGRSMWYDVTAIDMALSTIVSRDTEDEDEEPTIRTVLSKSKEIIRSALGFSSSAAAGPDKTPESPDEVNEGREEGADDSADRVGAEVSALSVGGSQLEPIDLTQV